MDAFSLLMGGISLIGGIASESAQKTAQQKADEEQVRKYQYDIERIKEETAGTVGDIKREGAAYTRQQSAAAGAAGAEISSGTPLMSMIQTATSIERDITRVKRGAQLETEYYQQEIEKLKPKKAKPAPYKYSSGGGAH
jgi:hypothetical protein